MKKYLTMFLAAGLLVSFAAGCKKSDKKETICTPGEAAECEEGEVCIKPPGEDKFVCRESCDPEDLDACPKDLSCDPIHGGGFACVYPFIISGNVFDWLTLEGIPDARVIAADEGGLVVTNVAVTDGNGDYELAVPTTRDATGEPFPGTVTLKVSARDYQLYPYGLRPAIPVDMQNPVFVEGSHYSVRNLTTDVALFPLEDAEGLGTVSGRVEAENPRGALIVAEDGPTHPSPYTFADQHGEFIIFNVPQGVHLIRAYKAGLQATPVEVDVGDSETVSDVILEASPEPLGSVSGSINIVNAPGDSATSIVLVPESTFMETFVRGVVPPGLRAPEPGIPPSIKGDFQINGVPNGDYVVLAAFEKDGLVRDPDPGIAGTDLVYMSVPSDEGERDVSFAEAFKVTEALAVYYPGAEEPEAIDPVEQLIFIWADDASETHYSIVVYNVFGELVWEDPDIPPVMGSATVEVEYGGPDFTPGMYYQFRATSHRMSGPISRTEDLRGVFFVPSRVD